VDYTHGNNQFFASTLHRRLNQFGGGNRPLEDVSLKPSDYVGTIGWTHTFGGTMLNELRFNGTRFSFDQTAPVGQTNFGIPQIRIFDFDAGGFGDPGRVLASHVHPRLRVRSLKHLCVRRYLQSGASDSCFQVWRADFPRTKNNNDQPGGERPDYQFRGILNFCQ